MVFIQCKMVKSGSCVLFVCEYTTQSHVYNYFSGMHNNKELKTRCARMSSGIFPSYG